MGLKLIDDTANPSRIIPEWFCLVVCSREYQLLPKKNHKPILDSKYTVVMETFDLQETEKIIRDRFEKISTNNWDDFYKEMEKVFLYLD